MTTLTEAKRHQLHLEYTNGFGLNGAHVKVDFYRLEKELQTKIKSVCIGSYCGKKYLRLHYDDMNQCEWMLNELIAQEKLNIQLCVHSLPSFGPKRGDVSFSFSKLEYRMLSQLQEFIAICGLRMLNKDDNRLDIWNWKTTDGQAYCNELRQKLGLSIQDPKNDPNDYHNWLSYTDFKQHTT